MSAPAGFGKTTLLAEWLAAGHDERSATAWLSLDPRDNDPAVFWSYVIAALQRAVPEVGRGALAVLQSAQPPIEPRRGDAAQRPRRPSPTRSCWCSTTTTSSSRPSIHEAMAFLLDHLPPQVHLVIASRADPPLPLARLRARGELLEIRAADLRFTADEAAAYLNERDGPRT